MNPRTEVVLLPEPTLPAAIVEERVLPNGMKHTTIALRDLQALKDYLESKKEPTLAANFAPARALFFVIIVGVLIVSIAFICTGIALVYLGATGNSELSMFGLQIKSANVGIVSIALGALVMILLFTRTMRTIRELLGPSR